MTTKSALMSKPSGSPSTNIRFHGSSMRKVKECSAHGSRFLHVEVERSSYMRFTAVFEHDDGGFTPMNTFPAAQYGGAEVGAGARCAPRLAPLRMLFMAANPLALARLDIASEFRELDEALGWARESGRIDYRLVLLSEAEDIRQHILRFRPSVVHFSAHGGASEGQREGGGIMLNGPDGVYAVSPKALASFFASLNGAVRCVVVNACDSERQAEASAEAVDCVIGMRGPISDRAGTVFTGAFYEAIAYGESVDTAFRLGSAAIGLHGLDESDVPCLAVRPGVDAGALRLCVGASPSL